MWLSELTWQFATGFAMEGGREEGRETAGT